MAIKLTQRNFEDALLKLETPKGKQLQFLKFHANAKGRALNMRRLAQKVGYKSWRAMNLQYGLLARSIGLAAGITKPDISLLVEFIPPEKISAQSISNSEWILIMREPFAKALKRVGWI